MNYEIKQYYDVTLMKTKSQLEILVIMRNGDYIKNKSFQTMKIFCALVAQPTSINDKTAWEKE